MDLLGQWLDRAFRRWMPDPFPLALALTALVLVLGAAVGDAFPADVDAWGRVETTWIAWRDALYAPKRADGTVIEGNLYFAFQMCVMLVTGHALAVSAPVAAAIRRVAGLARSARSAAALVALAACTLALLHWALGLIGGALVAREVGRECARRSIRAHYPLLAAAGYSGLMIWGGGLSGSIPLKAREAAIAAPFGDAWPYAAGSGVPLDATLWSPTNLAVCLVLLVLVPATAAALVPADPDRRTPCALPPAAPAAPAPGPTPAGSGRGPLVAFLEDGRAPAIALGLFGLGAAALDVIHGRFALSFNTLNALFLFGGIAAHRSLLAYAEAVAEGARGCAGILLQFPFYFGILGVLIATGLGGMVARGMVELSTPATYPWLTFLSAGAVNLLVPSGGGQWIVQGPIVVQGALAHGADLGRSVLALAYGDGWTNMLQPFWALPLLAITGLSARDIVGYTAAFLLTGGAAISAVLLLSPGV